MLSLVHVKEEPTTHIIHILPSTGLLIWTHHKTACTSVLMSNSWMFETCRRHYN